MRLKKLYLQKYKNLDDFNIDFQPSNGLTILIGNNGSGKSNLLEIISGIFHDLFKEKPSRKIDCDYTLEYVLEDISCRMEQKGGTLRCYAPKFKPRDKFISENAPNSVIGLYSGEDDRLWTQFYQPYYNAYIRRIKTNRYLERMRLIFIDKYYWSIGLLTLLLSSNDTLTPFIEGELGIRAVNKVEMVFNFRNYSKTNDLLKSFIDRINPKHETRLDYALEDLKQAIFYDFLVTEKGQYMITENGERILLSSGITDTEVFRYLTQAYMPKGNEVISQILIVMNGGITVQQLSEGEKKLILAKTVLEILADEKALVLMDEPDAHLHEERKPSLINMMRDYQNRQIVVATHSPIIAQQAREAELIMLEATDGKAALMCSEKREKIKRLTGSAWDIIGQDMILQSSRPLVAFEGKTDVKYVTKAIQMLQLSEPKYQIINVDFINCGGADNAQFFIHDLLSVIPDGKQVYLFFDRDDSGKKGAAAVLGISKDDEAITHFAETKKGYITVGFIPYREGVSSGDFLIEDYFLWDFTVKKMVEKEVESKHHPLKQLPSLASTIKRKIEEDFEHFSPAEYLGFKPLVEKLYLISTEAGHE